MNLTEIQARQDAILLSLFHTNRLDRLQHVTWLSSAQKSLCRYYASLQATQAEKLTEVNSLKETIRQCDTEMDTLMRQVNDANAQKTLKRAGLLRAKVHKAEKRLKEIYGK